MLKHILVATALAFSFITYAQTDSATYFLQKGLDEKQKGRRMESLRQFEKAYNLNNNDLQATRELAAAYLDLRRYGQARETFKKLEALGDHTDSTYRSLMNISMGMRQFDDAIKYAQQLKKVKPDEKVAYYIGKANYENGNLGEAIKYMEVAASEDPKNAEIPYTQARAYADMQNFKLAIPWFQKAVALNPGQTRWIYEMALIYYGMNDDRNALKYMLEAADKGYKKDNEFLTNLSVAYINTGNYKEGINVLKELLQRRPTDINILNSLAQASYDAKNYDDAINYFDQIMKIDNKNAEALYMIGMSFQNKGEKEKGMALCDKAIQLDPSLQNLKQKKQMPGGF